MTGNILSKLRLDADGIYSYDFISAGQDDERRSREAYASFDYKNYLDEISRNSSIPVMDREVDIFLKKIPRSGIIVDVGGCWGWHWRRNATIRPDVTVFIVDFIRKNLIHAKKVLGDSINNSVFLVHGDATSLAFDDNTFDGWWSVQVLQHIPNFKKAISEARRVLKPGGIFMNYSLNNQPLARLIYRIMGKQYHIKGEIPGRFYLSRASSKELDAIKETFSNEVKQRFCEVFFQPELRIRFPGKESSIIGKIDSFLSMDPPLFAWIARQRACYTTKIMRDHHDKSNNT
jgi:ubiquinone/menaquinone biosynthesis C-methylase UbiE